MLSNEVKRKASSAAFDAARAWKAQKLELKSVRDNAVARADRGDKRVKKLLLEDAAKCKYYQSKITELQSSRDRDGDKDKDKDKDAAAIEKGGSASASPTTEELSTEHT